MPRPNIANTEPSPSLYYVYGAMRGDGTFNRHDIRLGSTKKEFRDSVAHHLKKLGLRVFTWTQTWTPKGHGKPVTMHIANVNSKTFAEWLRTNHEIPSEFYLDFIRGFYEAEGSRSWCQVKFCGTDKELLLRVKRILYALGYRTNMIKKEQHGFGTKPLYVLYTLGGSKVARKLLAELNPCIKPYKERTRK